jgi:two-component system NtrC family sensor kinase
MNSALLVVDMDGHVSFCNPPAARILGEAPEALRGRPVWAWFASDEEELSLLARTLSTGVSYKGAERIILRADGTPVPVGISCSPFFDSTGERIGAVAIFQDLTEVKQLQSQVLQTEKMASIGQLAAGVAHEINNPMGFIHANLFQMAEYLADMRQVWTRVDDLLQLVRGDDLESIRAAGEAVTDTMRDVDLAYVVSDFGKAIRESQEGSERIRHIVQDLRDFSHHDSSEHVLADVNQCLDSTATIVWPMMKQIVVLEKDYEELDTIACYPMQIKQVFMNLLVNAYQSIEARVGESGETGKLWLRTRQHDDGVAIEVTDTGIGIPASHIDRIFDPFFTTKKVGLGTGLGLSTSFGIVKRHGGSLTVDSKEGEGTTFRVFLPVAGALGQLDGI